MDLSTMIARIRSIEGAVRRLERREGAAINLTNRAGVTLAAGEVVVLDLANDSSVIHASGAGAQAPLVVIVGADNEMMVKCTCRGYGKISIICDGPAIIPGDAIVASASAGCGQADNTANARNLLGFALTSKPAGVTRAVTVLV